MFPLAVSTVQHISLCNSQFIDPHNGVASDVWLKHDDGVRKTSAHILSRLPSAFNKDGTTTAGNSSQVTDAAARPAVKPRLYAAGP